LWRITTLAQADGGCARTEPTWILWTDVFVCVGKGITFDQITEQVNIGSEELKKNIL
jgi:hypothetical protein